MNASTVETVELPMRTLPVVVRMLQERLPGGGVLSVYLDTSPARTIRQGYLIAFHDACKAIRQELEGADAEDRQEFEAAVGRVDVYLAEPPALGAPGLAIFASKKEGVVSTALPIRPTDRVVWAERPAIEPILEALDDYERVAVVLFDKERSRLFTVYLGEIEERHLLVDEVPGKQGTGDWFALSQKRYERHHEDHVLRHAKRTFRALMDQLRTHPFDRLFVGGPDEAVSLFLHHVPRPLRVRFAGTLPLELLASDAEVLTAALAAAEAAERREEEADVRTLIDDARTSHVALGLESTLAALHRGRVHQLYLAADLRRGGARCKDCGRLTTELNGCPVCAGATRPVADLGEQAVEEAIAQDARIDVVAGPASALLLEHGGLGARTRY